MPTAPPLSRDPALDTQFFWLKHKTEILAVIVIAILAAVGFGGYRLYAAQQSSSAATLLGNATNDQDYRAVISRYPGTPAAASAYIFLAEAERQQKKFQDANTTLQSFIEKNPDHELVPTAKMAMAANFESMEKTDEALAQYQQIAASYAKSFDAPLALMSEVPLLKAKNRAEEARQICERVMTDYRDSFWSMEASRQLRLLKPAAQAQAPAPVLGPTIPPLLAAPAASPAAPPRPSAVPNKQR
jgi:TolA-binding protein